MTGAPSASTAFTPIAGDEAAKAGGRGHCQRHGCGRRAALVWRSQLAMQCVGSDRRRPALGAPIPPMMRGLALAVNAAARPSRRSRCGGRSRSTRRPRAWHGGSPPGRGSATRVRTGHSSRCSPSSRAALPDGPGGRRDGVRRRSTVAVRSVTSRSPTGGCAGTLRGWPACMTARAFPCDCACRHESHRMHRPVWDQRTVSTAARHDRSVRAVLRGCRIRPRLVGITRARHFAAVARGAGGALRCVIGRCGRLPPGALGGGGIDVLADHGGALHRSARGCAGGRRAMAGTAAREGSHWRR